MINFSEHYLTIISLFLFEKPRLPLAEDQQIFGLFTRVSLTSSPESRQLDWNRLACYIVRSSVNNSLLLKGPTRLKFINGYCLKSLDMVIPPHVLKLHRVLRHRPEETTDIHLLKRESEWFCRTTPPEALSLFCPFVILQFCYFATFSGLAIVCAASTLWSACQSDCG